MKPSDKSDTSTHVDTEADARRLHGSRVVTGLTPLIWGGVVVVGVIGVLIWQLT